MRTTTARCLVITGADPAFCSGDDVKQIMGGGEAPPPVVDRTPRLTPAADALLHTDVPVVAAVNGAAVGWGMELALFADIRVASERARFGELFVLRGLVQRRRRDRSARQPGREGEGSRAAVHRRRHRRRRGAAHRARRPGRAPRRAAAHCDGPGRADRRQPAARGAAAEAGPAARRRTRTGPTWVGGCRRTSPSCSAPTTTARA